MTPARFGVRWSQLYRTARLDKLGRHVDGDVRGWSVVYVPSLAAEERRHLHRELTTLTSERARIVSCIKGLLALHGVVLAPRGLPRQLPSESLGTSPLAGVL